MTVEVSDLCSSCRQIPGLGGLTVEATINTLNRRKEKGERPPFGDDEFNAMIYSCIYEYRNRDVNRNIDVSHPCLRLISDMLPRRMKGRY